MVHSLSIHYPFIVYSLSRSIPPLGDPPSDGGKSSWSISSIFSMPTRGDLPSDGGAASDEVVAAVAAAAAPSPAGAPETGTAVHVHICTSLSPSKSNS